MRGTVEEAAFALLHGAVRRGAAARLEVHGACLAPLVRPGDHVGVGPGEPRPGRLAVARDAAGALVCHRVLRRTPSGFLLAGDRSSGWEEHPVSSVVGVVSWIERDGRRLRLDGAGLLDRVLALRVPGAPRRGWEPLRRLLARLRGLAWHFAT